MNFRSATKFRSENRRLFLKYMTLFAAFSIFYPLGMIAGAYAPIAGFIAQSYVVLFGLIQVKVFNLTDTPAGFVCIEGVCTEFLNAVPDLAETLAAAAPDAPK